MTSPKKYKNKYRNDTTRLAYWDYGNNGSYFITICTNNRVYYFGNIIKDTKFCVTAGQNVMQFTELGKQAEKCAIAIPEHFPFVHVDEFIIMPDHVHLLFTISKTDDDNGDNDGNNYNNNNNGNGNIVGTQNFASLQYQPPQPSLQYQPPQPPQQRCNRFGPQSKNVASIIRGYKIGVTRYARENNINFQWQSRFYDHVVRNSNEFECIKNYIHNNVRQWGKPK